MCSISETQGGFNVVWLAAEMRDSLKLLDRATA